MLKIAEAEVNATLIKAAGLLDSQQTRIHELEQELQIRDRAEHAEKIASVAVSRGIMEEDEASEYAQSLVTGDKDLDMVEEFINRTAAGVTLGNPLEKDASVTVDDGSDVLTDFLLSTDIS